MNAKPVIVGIDGSPDSARALQWAADYARRFDAPLECLITWEISPVYGYPVVIGDKERGGMEEQSRKVLQETVRETLADDAQVVTRVEQGHPAAMLVAASEDAQLLVVGSRGRGSFAGMLLGSVSQHCVVHAKCPVAVMPHGGVKKKK